MTTAKNDYVPKDYTDLYLYYIQGSGNGNSLCRQIIRSIVRYADQDEQDTLAHDVFVRMYEKKILDVFDPTKSNFGGVVFFVTRTVCVNHLSKKSRNPVTGLKGGTLVESDPETEVFTPGLYSLDRLFPTETQDPGERMDLKETLEILWQQLQQLADKPRHTRDRNLLPLLELLLEERDPEECGAKLGVTASTIHNWVHVIQDMATEIKDTILQPRKRPLPPGKMLPTEE